MPPRRARVIPARPAVRLEARPTCRDIRLRSQIIRKRLAMLNRTRIAHRCLALLLGPALLYVAGCSDDGVGKRYPVSGTVKYKGEPVAKARISLYPKGDGRGASGDVTDGTFSSLTT